MANLPALVIIINSVDKTNIRFKRYGRFGFAVKPNRARAYTEHGESVSRDMAVLVLQLNRIEPEPTQSTDNQFNFAEKKRTKIKIKNE